MSTLIGDHLILKAKKNLTGSTLLLLLIDLVWPILFWAIKKRSGQTIPIPIIYLYEFSESFIIFFYTRLSISKTRS